MVSVTVLSRGTSLCKLTIFYRVLCFCTLCLMILAMCVVELFELETEISLFVIFIVNLLSLIVVVSRGFLIFAVQMAYHHISTAFPLICKLCPNELLPENGHDLWP